MKVTEQVEHLLQQGRKPKELVELGFPKSVVTRVRRQRHKKWYNYRGQVNLWNLQTLRAQL